MGDWQITIPFRDREDLVLDAITAARGSQLREDEVQVVDVLARDALERGVTTVGELLDELGQLDRSETRRRLDWAREKAGLISATEADRRREDAKFERELERLQPPPPPRWSPLQGCPARGCNARPMTPEGGWREVEINRWWCPSHRHLAGPDDFQPHESPYLGIGLNGQLIASEKEKARIAEWMNQQQEEQEREREQREELRSREGEAIKEAKERYADEGEISVMGIRTRPDLTVIE